MRTVRISQVKMNWNQACTILGLEELVTPPLTRGDILPGITRDSIISSVRESEKFPVREGNIKMQDLSSAVKEGRLFEAFGSGTAAIITPISVIHYKGEVICHTFMSYLRHA